jgi:hypothetical protein
VPGWKSSWTGTLQNADIQDYLQGQAVPRFADATARNTAIGSPDGGQLCWMDSPNGLFVYQDTAIASPAWVCLWSPWSDWPSPSWQSGVTSVDGSWDVVYRIEGGSYHIRGQYTLGGSDSVSGIPAFNFSAFLDSAAAHISAGSAWLRDATGDIYSATSLVGIGSQHIQIVNEGGIDATSPFTWTTNDLILWDIVVTHPDLDAQ